MPKGRVLTPKHNHALKIQSRTAGNGQMTPSKAKNKQKLIDDHHNNGSPTCNKNIRLGQAVVNYKYGVRAQSYAPQAFENEKSERR